MFAEVEHRLGEAVVVLQEVEVPQLHVQDEGRGGDLGVEHYTPVEAARAVLAAGTASAPKIYKTRELPPGFHNNGGVHQQR